MEQPVRVRFAPSPTGHLHVGGARTALFNYLFAKRQGGVFVLRIEDTDVERSTEESTRMILDDLTWLGLAWDEGPKVGGAYGPYFQSQRMDLYRRRIEELLGAGRAYRCFCSAELLEQKRQEALAHKLVPKYDGTCRALDPEIARHRAESGEANVVRLKIPAAGTTILRDLIRGQVAFENEILDDWVLLRTNGQPTYNFAVVVDDAAMKISHVIRGDDHISNTPRQIHLYQALGETLPEFAHVPMILGPDKTRLSKRHGATSVGAYADQGYVPEALVNYLALLGWSFDDKTTLFSRKDLCEKFSLEKVSKNPAVFDPPKLMWMNGTYLRQMAKDDYVARAFPFLKAAGLITTPVNAEEEAWLGRVLLLVQNNLKLLSEAPALTSYFFGDQVDIAPEAQTKLAIAKEKPGLFLTLLARMRMLESFTHQPLEDMFKALMAESGAKFGDLVHPLRAAVTGRVSSPGIIEVLELLGKERVVRRFEQGLHSVGIEPK